MKSYCYDDQDSNCTKYGRLYTWASAMDSAGIWSENGTGCGYNKRCSPDFPVRGVCPNGWHLPDTTEWLALNVAAGGVRAGDNLKASSGWSNVSGGHNGSDAYGFSALPAGERKLDDFPAYANRYTFLYEGSKTYFWSSNDNFGRYISNGVTKEGDLGAWLYSLHASASVLSQSSLGKYNAYSVRCVKDEKNVTSYSSSSIK